MALADSDLGDALAQWCGAQGIALHGVADVSRLFADPWGSYPRAVSLALPIAGDVMAPVRAGPTAGYHDAYRAANAQLNDAAQRLEYWLRARGHAALAFPATVASGQLTALGDGLSAAVQHKTVATRAGLGWIGKNALLITPQLGPRVRLASVFTDAPLPVATPIAASRCGACGRCVRACPASALCGASWQVGMAREALVDVAACRDTAERLLLERAGRHDAVCGVCIAVCPYARTPSP